MFIRQRQRDSVSCTYTTMTTQIPISNGNHILLHIMLLIFYYYICIYYIISMSTCLYQMAQMMQIEPMRASWDSEDVKE